MANVPPQAPQRILPDSRYPGARFSQNFGRPVSVALADSANGRCTASQVAWSMIRNSGTYPVTRISTAASANAVLGADDGRSPAFDHVLTFKILLPRAMRGQSGERHKFPIRDRLFVMCFLGLDLANPVADANSIWAIRGALKHAGAVERLRQAYWLEAEIRSARAMTRIGISACCALMNSKSRRRAGWTPQRMSAAPEIYTRLSNSPALGFPPVPDPAGRIVAGPDSVADEVSTPRSPRSSNRQAASTALGDELPGQPESLRIFLPGRVAILLVEGGPLNGRIDVSQVAPHLFPAGITVQ